ncbi:MAG: hypothetical protein JXL67_12895 [Calditrichaeota bacterium]|nr:hypothetical protein [Calditrichota bacterium]
MKHLYVLAVNFFFFFLLQANAIAITDSLSAGSEQEIRLNAYVEESRVPMNQPVVLRVELSWPGRLNRYQIEPVSQPILTNLLLEGSGSENRLITGEDGTFKALKAVTYRLRPLEMGMAYIDGIVIRYTDRETGEEERLTSQRIMVEIIEPIPEEESGRLKAISYIVLFVILFGVIIYFFFQFIKKRRLSGQQQEPLISLPEAYLNRLSQDVDPRGTNLDEMIQRLSRIFKEYLEKDFSLPARELSTKEITQKLYELPIDEVDKNNLSSVFEKLDMIKFARKGIDPSEFTQIYGTIENFLLKRKQKLEMMQQENKEEK